MRVKCRFITSCACYRGRKRRRRRHRRRPTLLEAWQVRRQREPGQMASTMAVSTKGKRQLSRSS
eukprot:2265364-Prymnesium_polylepis.1